MKHKESLRVWNRNWNISPEFYTIQDECNQGHQPKPKNINKNDKKVNTKLDKKHQGGKSDIK